MVVINSHYFGIEPKDSKIMQFLTELDPDYVELFTRDSLDGKCDVYGISLETAEWTYKGVAVWVCPD